MFSDVVGLALSTTLVNAGLTDFSKLVDSNPRELELVFGCGCAQCILVITICL